MEHYAAIKERLVARSKRALIELRLDEPSRAIFRNSAACSLRPSCGHERLRRLEQRLRAALRARLHARRRLAADLRPCRHPHLARQAQCRQCAGRDPRDERTQEDPASRRHDRAGTLAEFRRAELHRSGASLLSRPAASHGRDRSRRAHLVHQRFQGDQCRFRREGARLLSRRHLLDPRRQGEGGRHPILASPLPPCREGLSDRRGDARVRGHARLREGEEATLRHARGRRVASRSRCRGITRAGSRWCCSRRLVPPTISSRISKRAAIAFGSWRAR